MKEFCKKLCKKLIFFLQNNSVENSLICPKKKSASHCPTELFPIYPNNHWTIRRRDDHIVVPSSNRIKLKIDWFLLTNTYLGVHRSASENDSINLVTFSMEQTSFNINNWHFILATNTSYYRPEVQGSGITPNFIYHF